MLRKFSAVFVVLALMLQLVPGFSSVTKAAVGNESFVFPGQSTNPASPVTTSDSRITLQGSINNVNPSTITYSIYQIVDSKNPADPTDDVIGQSKLDQTSNIYNDGNNITIFNLELFPGQNKITFKGLQGGGEVTDTYYINYRNGPLLYNLTAAIDGASFPIDDIKTTVVYSNASKGKNAYDISITGNAPNAQNVTIIVNGNSKTYSVNPTNNNSFVASPVSLNKGKNLVTIRVTNNSQTIETTRQITFYNGSATFYDVNVNEGSGGSALEYYPNYSYADKSKVQVVGKVIVPNARYADVVGGAILPHPDPAFTGTDTTGTKRVKITYSLTGSTSTVAGSVYATPEPGSLGTDAFLTYNFTLSPSDLQSSGLLTDKLLNLSLLTDNEYNKKFNITPTQEGTSALGFTLQDGGKPYIYQVNYLSGFNGSNQDSLSGSPLDGTSISALPFAVEILIGNAASSTQPSIASVILNNGTTAGTDKYDYEGLDTSLSTVNKLVNGTTQSFKRVLLQIKKMPITGTQTINFTLNDNSALKPAKINLLYGPFINFTKATDGMVISVDTTQPPIDQAKNVLQTALGNISGSFFNIPDSSTIRYDATGGTQTVSFYINNSLVALKQDGLLDPTKFVLKATSDEDLKLIYSKFYTGENKLRIVYQTATDFYEKVIKVNVVPTNLPVIPAPGTSGVFPYSVKYGDEPVANDPNYPMKGSIYTTNLSDMNVYGTFDFIDLGTDINVVNSKISTMIDSAKQNYILKIMSPGQADRLWDLSKPFQLVKGGKIVGTVPATGASFTGDLTVRYDLDTQAFSFIMKNQKLNADGTSKIYNFFVYNSGVTGPRASYRLEVDPTSIPYKVLRPILPEKSIVNQNYIEVILDAPGADKVVISGGDVKSLTMEKFDFDSDNDGTIDYKNAYRALITGLKAGKANKIEYVISNGKDSTKDSISISYVPTNIPGAAFLKDMANSNKVFDGAINLTLPKGTSLIRPDASVPANLKNQIFDGHKFLYALANAEDGVVDRHEYETLPSNFDLILQSFGTRFNVSFPTHFIKSSSMYWIDAGLADDPSTNSYDPLKRGVDPYQFPGAIGEGGTKIPTYDDRPDNRELITSKVGTLELQYDPNMRDTNGTIMTVFRYDVKNKYWENMGGTVDTKKHTIKVPFTKFGYYVVGKMVYSYLDVTQHPYARNYMEAIYAKGVMNNNSFDAFGADLYTSRGEFARIMVKAMGIPLNFELSKSHFDDVPYTINPDALWDYRYVETAAREGFIRGMGPRTFEPNTNLTRAEAAVIIARALNLKLETDATKINKELEKTFKDYAAIDYYARASVLAIAKKGFINGSPIDSSNPKKGYVFEPKSNLARSDAAIIVAKILVDQKKLPKIN